MSPAATPVVIEFVVVEGILAATAGSKYTAAATANASASEHLCRWDVHGVLHAQWLPGRVRDRPATSTSVASTSAIRSKPGEGHSCSATMRLLSAAQEARDGWDGAVVWNTTLDDQRADTVQFFKVHTITL